MTSTSAVVLESFRHAIARAIAQVTYFLLSASASSTIKNAKNSAEEHCDNDLGWKLC
jgi:hypothetical protein